jgi:hypothetical protein
MLQNLDDQVSDCRQRASACVEQANEASDPRQRADWLALEGRYLAIARGIETKRSDGSKGHSFRSRSSAYWR